MRFFTQHMIGPSDDELGKGFLRPKTLVRFLATAAILAGVLLLVVPRQETGPVDVRPNQPALQEIRARFAFSVENKRERTSELERKLAAVRKVYTYDAQALERVLASVSRLIDTVGRFEDDNEARAPEERKGYEVLAKEVLREVGLNLTSPTLKVLSAEIRSNRFKDPIERIFRQMYEQHLIVEPWYERDWVMDKVQVDAPSESALTPERLDPASTLVHPGGTREALDRYLTDFYEFSNTPEEQALRAALQDLTVKLTQYSLKRDAKKTEAALARARASVQPVIVHFKRGQVIMKRGAAPSEFDLAALREHRVQIRKYRAIQYGAHLFIVLAMLLFLVIYVRRYRPLLRFRTSSIVITGIPLLVVLFIGRLSGFLLADQYAPDAAGYMYPAALLGMLGVVLLDTEMAILLVVVGSALIGLATGMSLAHAIPALFGGLTAIVALYRLRQRSQLFVAAIYVAIVQVLVIGAIRFVQDPTGVYYGALILGTVNGALSYLLALGMFPLFESLFGITTDLRLLELTGIYHPLLREVEEQAPGTYQHSLSVAKLAEGAADAIGANYLLVRAGAYFHDVGKALKPRYFSENQISAEERRTHKKLTPYMSCLIIRNHVKEGMELARRYGIPERVVDFIPQHHGTCLIKFFYHEAVRQYEESESAEPVREEDFRYPGPKPQSIEAAIVMVADSVEATATSRLNRPRVDEDDIRRLVNDAIQDKFSDGQFDECHLTLRQLHEIRESMVRTLVGRFHHRIDYPTMTPGTGKKASREPAAA